MSNDAIVPSTDVQIVSAGSYDPNAIQRVKQGNINLYSSFTGNDTATKLKVYQATTNAERLDDHKGEVINLANVVIQEVNFQQVQQGTGQVDDVTAAQVILIDADGTAYAATSKGIFSSVERLIGILGEPSTWEGPVAVKATEVRTRSGFKALTLDLA